MTEGPDLIEDYLDELMAGLRGAPREVRRMLAETEQHLHESAHDGLARGLSSEQAAREAIDRFGPADRVARDWNANAPAATALGYATRVDGQWPSQAGVRAALSRYWWVIAVCAAVGALGGAALVQATDGSGALGTGQPVTSGSSSPLVPAMAGLLVGAALGCLLVVLLDLQVGTAAAGAAATSHTLGRLRRRRGVIIAGGLIGVIAGLCLAWLNQPSALYSSTTRVKVLAPVDQTSVTGARTNSSVNMDNELQVITSDKVADAAKALLRVDIETDVLERQLTATVPANTSVIDVSFSASTPEEAVAGSHAFAQAYIDYRTDQAKSQIAVLSEVLGTQLKGLNASVAKYAGQVAATAPSSTQHQFALTELDILKTSVADVNGRLTPLSTIDPTAGEIIQDASIPTTPSNAQPVLRYMLLGLVIGLLLGALLALMPPRRPTTELPAPSTA